ncbi:MAG: hypothetical protein KJ698_08195 [Actinobacteria bacterium]|nr:hypothetical protein [Actinomycetota bacterium]MBU1493470.1 hypothetical protein [Actinomycetota bacterium]
MALLMASGCSGEGSSVATTSAPTNPSSAPVVGSSQSAFLEQYEGDGFEMLLPSKWSVLTHSDADFGSMLEGTGEHSEALEQWVIAMFDQGARLFAFDELSAHPGSFGNINTNAQPGSIDNISIIELPLPGLTVTEVESVTVQQVKDFWDAKDIESEIRTFPAGEAVIVYCGLPNTRNEGITVRLLTDSTQWVITLVAMDVGPLEEHFETMLDSFRETP